LEMERHALQMFTSCGWFFNDLSGIETILILQHAYRAIELAEGLSAPAFEDKFMETLSLAKSNLPEMGDGRQIYERFGKPRRVSLEQAVNHFVIASLFENGEKKKRVFSYQMERPNYERLEKDGSWIVLGRAKVTPEMIPEAKDYLFVLIPSKNDILRTWIFEPREDLNLAVLRAKGQENLGKNEEGLAEVFTSIPWNTVFTLQDVFREERQSLFQKLIQKERDEHRRIYAELFDKTRLSVEPLVRLGLEIPFEIRVASEVTLSDRLFREIEKLQDDFRNRLEQGAIDRIIEEARRGGYDLRREASCSILDEMLNQRMSLLRRGMVKGSLETTESKTEKIEELITLIERAEKWGFQLRIGEAQNIMSEMLDSCFGELEMGWWGWGSGAEKPIPPNLIPLAEKLGFNVDRFSKMKIT
jgi:hypothetical protein